MNSLTLTPDQLDLLTAAMASTANYAAAERLTAAARAELALQDRRGRENGATARIVDAILAGCDPDAVAEHLDSEAAAVEARAAAARDSLAALRVQLDAHRVHLRRHDGHVSAMGRSLAGEVTRLQAVVTMAENARTRELHALTSGGFTMDQAMKTVDHSEARAVARKLDALAAAGIDPADAPPVLSDAQMTAQQRQRAARLLPDLERIHDFQRDAVRDVRALPDWVRAAIEAGAVDLHDDEKNRRLIPA
jgi:hypothetical protein